MRRPRIISREEKLKSQLGATMSLAAYDVLIERRRQITSEGWTPEHDDDHVDGSLANAAACYAATTRTFKAEQYVGRGYETYTAYEDLWPKSWADHWWRPRKSRRRKLIVAAALILAEIERLDRAEQLSDTQRPESER